MATPQEQVEKLGAFLMENHIPSIGPAVGMNFIGILKAVKEAKDKSDDPVVTEQLEEYEAALEMVTMVSILQQKLVIAKLGALIGAPRETHES